MLSKDLIKALYSPTIHYNSNYIQSGYYFHDNNDINRVAVNATEDGTSLTLFHSNEAIATVDIVHTRIKDEVILDDTPKYPVIYKIESSLNTILERTIPTIQTTIKSTVNILQNTIQSCVPRHPASDSPQPSVLHFKVQITGTLSWADFDCNRRVVFDVLGEDFDLRPDESIAFEDLEDLGKKEGEGEEGCKIGEAERRESEQRRKTGAKRQQHSAHHYN